MHKIANFNLTLKPISITIVAFIVVVTSIFYIGCHEEDIFAAPTENISFSVDTLRFDTVFTSLGSATRSVRLINNSDDNISLASIRFESNELSKFRMNVDGLPGEQFQNIEIRGNDSLYIFVEVTIDPEDPLSSSPFIIEDAIVIEGGNISQKIVLEAWGQNANYIPSRFNAGGLVRLTCNNEELVWDDPKPYVVYGILFIDSCDIIMPSGTQIYVHGGLANFDGVIANDGALFFQESGRLITNGTVDEPVVFQGDRLEQSFSDVPGQWTGIRFLSNSQDNRLRHTIIKNSVIGLRADSAASVDILQSQIYSTTNAAVIGIHADINVENSLFYSNGSSGLFLGYGGNYDISYCTFSNYGNQQPAVVMDNFQCLDSDCNTVALNNLNASFKNCIIMGSGDDEILYLDATEGNDAEALNISFQNCLVKIDELEGDAFFESICQSCITVMQGDSTFVNRFENDYHLHPMSPAKNSGLPIFSISIDLEDQLRDSNSPDIGCYESI
jgi:hypothetical protein